MIKMHQNQCEFKFEMKSHANVNNNRTQFVGVHSQQIICC